MKTRATNDKRFFHFDCLVIFCFGLSILLFPYHAQAEEAKSSKISLDLAPKNALGVLTVRPANILSHRWFKTLFETYVSDEMELEEVLPMYFGVNIEDIEAIRIYLLVSPTEKHTKYQIAYLFRTKRKLTPETYFRLVSKEGMEIVTKKHKEFEYRQFLIDGKPTDEYVMFPDPFTFIASMEGSAIPGILDSIEQTNSTWQHHWEYLNQYPVTMLVDLKQLKDTYQQLYEKMSVEEKKQFDKDFRYNKTPMSQFFSSDYSPQCLTLRATFEDRVSVKGTLFQNNEGESIQKLLNMLLESYRGMYEMLLLQDENGVEELGDEKHGVQLMVQSLRSIKIARQKENIKMMTIIPKELIEIFMEEAF